MATGDIAAGTDRRARSWPRSGSAMFSHQVDQPGMHELMQELRSCGRRVPGDRVLVGESDEIAYYGAGDDELHLVFNFPLMRPTA